MRNPRALLAALVALLASAPVFAADTVDVIPRPSSVVRSAGPGFRVAAGTVVSVPAGDTDALAAADFLAGLVERSKGLKLVRQAATTTAPAIILRRGAVPGGPEAYAVTVGEHVVTVTAPNKAGLVYGAVTVWELMTAATQPPTGAVTLAAMAITDAPRFPWRGLMLDSVRHFQSPEFVARMLDWMALHKLNVLQWHLSDDQGWRLAIEHFPRLTSVGAWRNDPSGVRYGGFYTRADVRRLVALAAARNITIVPEIEMPGHALAALSAYPDLGFAGVPLPAAKGDWGVFPSIYGVGDNTFDFLETVLGEVMTLFPSKFIAIGGDEAVKDLWHASPAVQARMKALGIADEVALQGYFVRRIGTFLNAHDRRLIGWDEILLGGDLPMGDAVLSWHGADGAFAAAASGHDVVMATAPTLYLDNRQSDLASEPPGRGSVVSLRDVYDYDPGNPPVAASAVAAPFSAGSATHILGLQGQIWTEHITTEARVEAMALPRAAALAESGWTSSANRDWRDFTGRLPAQLARYRALGLHADDGAVAIKLRTKFDVAANKVTATLSNQVELGTIRFTTDGSEPSSGSSAYAGAVTLAPPVRLRAAAFIADERVSPLLDRQLDAVTLRHRVSQELRLCTAKVPLNLEGRATGGGTPPVFLVDIMNPCWIYPRADLGSIDRISVGVGALPFNYQLGADRAKIVLLPPSTPEGELVVRRDDCTGTVLAVMPLGGAKDGKLSAPVVGQQGAHDLCFQFTARTPHPLWALAWVQLEPASAR